MDEIFRIAAHGGQPDHVFVHPTQAGRLHAMMIIFDARDQMLDECGPRPPWWRPIKRRRWKARRAAIVSGADSAIEALLR